MEPALKTFLDNLHEQDNTVRLEASDPPEAAAVRNDNSSGMLDMRAMAQRYQAMRSSGEMSAEVEPLLLKGPTPVPVLAPLIETAEAATPRAHLVLALCAGAIALVMATAAVTAVVTAKVVRRSMVAEMNRPMQAPPASPALQPAMAATPEISPVPVEVPALAMAASAEAVVAEPTLTFEESDVEILTEPERSPVSVEGKVRAVADKPTEDRPVTPAERVSQKAPAVVAAAPVVAAPAAAPSQSEAIVAVVSQPAAEPEVAQEASTASCDEVLCLLEGRACCGGTAAMAAKPQTRVDDIDTSRPRDLSRSDLAAGIAPIAGRLESCGSRSGLVGAVTLKLKISAEGKVLTSSSNQGDAEFKSCVSKLLKAASFDKTQRGVSLSYPVIIR